mgnify:FL=1
MNPGGPPTQIPISALNHFTFCPRRCALIHVEGVFVENASTLRGRVAHEEVDDAGAEERPGVRIVRGLPLFSDRLGLSGRADVVEFRPAADGPEIPYPIEYKRGPRRQWKNDDLHACAQGLCLEDMFGVPVPRGAIFHIASRRRREVEFTPELRSAVAQTIQDIRRLLAAGFTPPAIRQPHCDGCSLNRLCLPEITEQPDPVRRASAAVFHPRD